MVIIRAAGGRLSSYAAPPAYSSWVSRVISLVNEIEQDFESGPASSSDSAYFEPGTISNYYAPAKGLDDARIWAARTGNTINSVLAGRDKSCRIYLDTWGDNAPPGYRRFSEVPYLAVTRGWSGNNDPDVANRRTAANSDIVNAASLASFSNASELAMGNLSYAYHGRMPAISREIAYALKSQVLHERAGLGEYEDGASTVCRPIFYECCINHLYRWMREWDDGNIGDNAANFMMGITFDALRYHWEGREALSTTWEADDWPSQVLSGEAGASPSLITNPYSDELELLNAFADWQFGAIDGYTPDTSSHPNTSSTYFRVVEAHTSSETSNTVAVGDPMVEVNGTAAECLYRCDSRFSGAEYWPQLNPYNICQMYWLSYRNHLEGNTTEREKYLGWGDALFEGNMNGTVGTQKEKNQQLFTIFEALDYRNLVTGRND